MSIAEQNEVRALAERVGELERKLKALEAQAACRETLHLKDKPRGK